MSFEEFHDGVHGGHLGYRNGTTLAILNLYVPPMPPIKFCLNPTYGLGGDVVWSIPRRPPWRPSWISERNDFTNFEFLCLCDASYQVSAQPDRVWEAMFEEFQDGRHGNHLEYLNGMILAILNLCVTVMLPIKFQLNPTFGLGGDVVWRISRWPPWQPSWISERNNLINPESLCRSDASHKVSAQSDLWFWRRYRLKHFKMAAVSVLNLCVTVMLPIKFWFNQTYGLGGDVVWRNSRWPP